MQYTESEIIAHAKRNGTTIGQIRVLAELNATTEANIIRILRKAGLEPDVSKKVYRGFMKKYQHRMNMPENVKKKNAGRIPHIVFEAIFDKLDAIEETITFLEKEGEQEKVVESYRNQYLELAEFLKGK